VRPDLEAEVRRIAADRTSGSLDLALAAVDLMAYETDPPPAVLRELAAALTAAQPDMIAVRNAVRSCLSARMDSVAGRGSYPDAISEFRRSLVTSRSRTARRLLEVIDRPVAVATLSRSSTVLEALDHLRASGRLRSVTVLESIPGGEGRLTTETLREHVDEVRLAPDEELETVAASSDVVVLGADALFQDGGILNKVLSRRLAERALEAGRRVYAVVETIKLDRHRRSPEWSPGARSLFEVVPPQLLTAIATEVGVFNPNEIASLDGEMGARA